MEQVHATTLDIDGRGVMLRGPSGSGKSDLGLRLIDAGARLVADDRTDLRVSGKDVMASAPEALAGHMEVRGVGILPLPSVPETRVVMVIDLVPAADVERLPKAETVVILGQVRPVIRLSAFEPSAPAKVRAALSYFCTL